jgi:NAD+ synthase (glutamine-hydrolysing)
MQQGASFYENLSREISACLQTGQKIPASLLQEARALIGPRGQGMMALAQINVTPGDLKGNAEKIMAYLAVGEALGLDLVAFPELALMGYPPRDIITRHPFVVDENLKWLEAIAKRCGQTYALLGFVEPRKATSTAQGQPRFGKPFFNSMAVLGQGQIQTIVRKSLLPAYGEFEDVRQFEPAPACGAFPPEALGQNGLDVKPLPEQLCLIHGKRYALSICEDIWNEAEFFKNPGYHHDPIQTLAAQKPDAFINISASPTRSRKEQIRHNLCSFLARKYQTPLVYVNQVGTVDEVSFDGASRVYDEHGQLVARANAFTEQFLIVNPFQKLGGIAPLPLGQAEALNAPKVFNAFDTSDLGRTYECLLQGIRDYFSKNGFRRAVIGLSGGLDSSVSVVLLADALGPENVLGVSMPSRLTPAENRTDAQTLADNLGITLVEIPIVEITEAFASGLSKVRSHIPWLESAAHSNALENVQAISRATLLRQLGNEFNALPVATSDKSELYLGYATVNGDMSGALAPLGDVPKTKVRALAHWLNHHRPASVKTPKNVIPPAIIQKPSGADLKQNPHTGKLVTAEEELMPYEFADEVIWRIEACQQSFEEMLAARFQYEEAHPITPEQKAEWLKKFYDRMARAVFKWFVSPPILIVEGNGSIAKTDYHHPIVAGRICWRGHTDAEIALSLHHSQESLLGSPISH